MVVVECGILVHVSCRAVHVVQREAVWHAIEETAIIGVAGLNVLDARTEVGCKREVAPVPVKIEDKVTIELARIVVGTEIGTILSGKERIGRSIVFLLVQAVGLVNLGTAGKAQAFHDVIGEATREDITVLVVDAQVTVDFPIGVHHRQSLVAEWPEHRLEVAFLVVLLVRHVLADILTGGEQVDRHDGVEVETLRDHVLLRNLHIHRTDIQVQFVVEEVGGVAYGEVVPGERVVLHNALGIGRGGRDKGLAVLRADGQRHGVLCVVAGLEEVHRVVA